MSPKRKNKRRWSDITILAATNNLKKRAELVRLLAPLGFDVVTAAEAGVDLGDVEETGTTFEQNALLKALSGCKASGLPCVADDSGLEIDALGGEPGVFSARYAGAHGDDARNNKKLLRALEHVPEAERTARFVCAACFCTPDGVTLTVRGVCEGSIAFYPEGSGGFGYDPLFLPTAVEVEKGKKTTMASLSDSEKDAISHRGAAIRQLAAKIGEYYDRQAEGAVQSTGQHP